MFSFCLTLKMVVWVSLVVQSSDQRLPCKRFHFRFHFHFLVFTQGAVKHLILPCEVLMPPWQHLLLGNKSITLQSCYEHHCDCCL